jgi:predicted Zn-dependent peptidase
MVAQNALADGVYEMKFKDGNALTRSFAIEKLRYGNHDRSKSYPARVRSVMKEDILRVANEYMHPEAFQVIVVGEYTNLQ